MKRRRKKKTKEDIINETDSEEDDGDNGKQIDAKNIQVHKEKLDDLLLMNEYAMKSEQTTDIEAETSVSLRPVLDEAQPSAHVTSYSENKRKTSISVQNLSEESDKPIHTTKPRKKKVEFVIELPIVNN